MRSMIRTALAVVCLLGVAWMASPASATLISLPTTLDRLIDADGDSEFVEVGGQRFSSFVFQPLSFNGAPPIDPSLIGISAVNDLASPGLFFQTPQMSVSQNQAMNLHLEFDVLILDPSKRIVNNILEFTGSQRGLGQSFVSETLQTPSLAPLGDSLVFAKPTGGVYTDMDMAEFAPQLQVHIEKNVSITANGAANDFSNVAAVGDFTQRFTQVPIPEPATMTLAALGLAAVAAVGAARRRTVIAR